jgi:hypothetical protein
VSQAEAQDANVAARLLLASKLAEGLAVRATFDPDVSVPPGQLPAVRAISDEVAGQWGGVERMLKERVRTDLLAAMLRRGGSDRLRKVRNGQSDILPSALQTVLDMFIDGRPLDIGDRSEAELMAALHVIRWGLKASSLASMPDLVPPGFVRDDVEGRLALMETLRPVREITADGCVGREEELSQLHRYVYETPSGQSLYDLPAMLVHGVGGVGKSTLVAQFVRELADRRTAWAYLDLDRPSLASFEPLALLRDIVRQIGSQHPLLRRALDSETLFAEETSKGVGAESSRREPWLALANSIAKLLVGVLDGPLVVVLDTYEELQRHDAREPSPMGGELYRMFARLSDDIPHFRLVVSGRAPATDFVASGHNQIAQEVLAVGPLAPAAAALALQRLYERELGRRIGASKVSAARVPRPGRRRLDPDLVEEVLRTVGRSPLTLKLAARVLAREGGAAVRATADAAHAAQRADALERVRAGFVEGFLYHRVLRHLRGVGTVEPETLQRIARACIPLRRITPDLLSRVVLPIVGATSVSTADVMAGLAAEAAFTEAESEGLRLRDELRGPALLALWYSDSSALIAEVHRRAEAFYAGRPRDPAAILERAYHQLAGGLPVDPALLEPEVLRRLADLRDDLTPDGRDLVTAALTDSSAIHREFRRRAREREVDAAVATALAAGNLDEAGQLLDDRSWWKPTTVLYASVSLLAERRGDLAAAVEASHRDREAAEAARDPSRFVAAAVRLALLFERLYDVVTGAAVLAGADGRPWLGDQPLLHLELRLNRLAMLERHRVPYDTWVERLEVRALLSRCEPDAVRARTSVVRLLAAALGGDEPRLVLDAVRAVGLGTQTYPSHVWAVARALAAWDVEPAPGAVARQIGLRMPHPATEQDLREAWTAAVDSPHTDVLVSLDRAFAVREPGAEVLAALRRVYLWWGVDPERVVPPGEDEDGGPPGRFSGFQRSDEHSGHFLDGGLDFADSNLQRLVRTLRGAYPKPEDVQSLAARAGVDLARVNWRNTSGRVVEEVFREADRGHRLGPLIREILADGRASPFHAEIREIVGSEWLRRQGITGGGATRGK